MTEKQKIFVKEYIIDFNATRSYIKAFKTTNAESARRLGSLLLTNIDIQAEVNKLILKRNKRLELSQDQVVSELSKIAFSDMSNYVDENGCLIGKLEELDETFTKCIKKIKVTPYNAGTKEQPDYQNKIELELHDKQKAIELLCRHMGILNDKLDVNTNVLMAKNKDEFIKARKEMLKRDDV